jgi:hypothetical protein
VKFGEWFKVEGTDMRWLKRSPANRTSRCDRNWSHVVTSEKPRLQVDNGEGPSRARGHGKQHEYLCSECAGTFYEQWPPSEMEENQGSMF